MKEIRVRRGMGRWGSFLGSATIYRTESLYQEEEKFGIQLLLAITILQRLQYKPCSGVIVPWIVGGSFSYLIGLKLVFARKYSEN